MGKAPYCQAENKIAVGFVEGLNNKIRVIQRRAHGLRDEEYLRLKALSCMLPDAYICKAGRAVQPVKYIAFYEANQIHPLIPLILEQHDEVIFERGKNPGRLGELVQQALDMSEQAYWPYKWSIHKVFLLSAPDAVETVKRKEPIENDMTSSSGQRTAFTQNQRYVSLEANRKAKTTSKLEEK